MDISLVIQLLLLGINLGLIYALDALGISLIWNASSLFNFCQADLVTLGGYVSITAVLYLKLPIPIAMIIAIVLMAIFGFILSKIYFYPMFERKLNNSIILIGSVALSICLSNGVLMLWGAEPQFVKNPFGTNPMSVLGVNIMPHNIWIIGIVAVLVTALQLFLRKTITGTAMRAVAQDAYASKLMGVRVDVAIALTFLLSTGLAALAGVMISPIMTLQPFMGSLIGAKAFAAVLVGGLGSFSGALVGGLIVGVSEVFFATLVASKFKDIFIFVVLIIFLLFRPQGIFRANVSQKV